MLTNSGHLNKLWPAQATSHSKVQRLKDKVESINHSQEFLMFHEVTCGLKQGKNVTLS
jgi:hypothetical protein